MKIPLTAIYLSSILIIYPQNRCSSIATIRTDEKTYDVEIKRGDKDNIYFMKANTEEKIARSEIRKIDHPGFYRLVIGTTIMGVGIFLGRSGLSSTGFDKTLGLAALAGLAVPGSIVALTGYIDHESSRSAARDPSLKWYEAGHRQGEKIGYFGVNFSF